MKSTVTYINPEFQEMLDFVPKHIARKVDLSFDIARRIHDILEAKCWSQEDFAKAAGKRKDVVRKWMSGHCNFSLRTVAFIEAVLGESIVLVERDI